MKYFETFYLLYLLSQPYPWAYDQSKGLIKVRAKRETLESHLMLPRM